MCYILCSSGGTAVKLPKIFNGLKLKSAETVRPGRKENNGKAKVTGFVLKKLVKKCSVCGDTRRFKGRCGSRDLAGNLNCKASGYSQEVPFSPERKVRITPKKRMQEKRWRQIREDIKEKKNAARTTA